jgi:hypothetical protein
MATCLRDWEEIPDVPYHPPDVPSYPPDFSQAQLLRKDCQASTIGAFQNNTLIHKSYRYTYHPQRDPLTGEIAHYALTAQPVNYGAPSVLSYYEDDLGKMTTTGANRYPTSGDNTQTLKCESSFDHCMELWHRH